MEWLNQKTHEISWNTSAHIGWMQSKHPPILDKLQQTLPDYFPLIPCDFHGYFPLILCDFHGYFPLTLCDFHGYFPLIPCDFYGRFLLILYGPSARSLFFPFPLNLFVPVAKDTKKCVVLNSWAKNVSSLPPALVPWVWVLTKAPIHWLPMYPQMCLHMSWPKSNYLRLQVPLGYWEAILRWNLHLVCASRPHIVMTREAVYCLWTRRFLTACECYDHTALSPTCSAIFLEDLNSNECLFYIHIMAWPTTFANNVLRPIPSCCSLWFSPSALMVLVTIMKMSVERAVSSELSAKTDLM